MCRDSEDYERAIETTRENYDKIADSFDVRTREMHNEEIWTFISLLQNRDDPTVLDVGCGAGRDVKIFAEENIDAVGIDFSSGMVDLARENVPEAEFERMDMRSLDFPPGSFDGVWSKDSLHHVPRGQIGDLLVEIHRVLETDGVFFSEVREGHSEGLERTDDYADPIQRFVTYWQEDEFSSLLSGAGFDVIESKAVPDEWADTGEKRPFRKIRVLCRKSTGGRS